MRIRRFGSPFFLFFLSGCAFFASSPVPPKSPLEEVRHQIHLQGAAQITAGAARVEITPPVGTPLAGHSKRQGRPSQGIRDPLYVRALVLSDGEDTAVFICADLLVFPSPMARRILKEVSGEFKIPPHAVALSATHTHSGSGGIAPGLLHRQMFGPYNPKVTEGIIGRTLWAVRKAMRERQPVRWAFHAKAHELSGLTENRNPASVSVDPSLSVLFLESEGGRPITFLINAAAHPTLVEERDLRFSADYPGELTRAVEAIYPGSVCLFANGAAGDLHPRDSLGNSPDERISRFGQTLAEVAVGLVNQSAPRSRGELAVWGWEVPLPSPQIRIGPIPLHPVIGRMIRPPTASLAVIALDRILLVPLPVEPTAELGNQLKHRLASSGAVPVLLGYSGGYLGVAVTPAQYASGSTEAGMSWYGPTFGLWLIEQMEELAKLYPSSSS
ncbi:MAG: neutral/alkaline non-lysosomal ceramidase N-terminal domain-containing protein [Candidatus Omnitrophica bacterium]|nr:neutral/alkaline non-lysosomal ceramidase N-terminal domain-containing protein [Candidatus Omnitrophota bacterium]